MSIWAGQCPWQHNKSFQIQLFSQERQRIDNKGCSFEGKKIVVAGTEPTTSNS